MPKMKMNSDGTCSIVYSDDEIKAVAVAATSLPKDHADAIADCVEAFAQRSEDKIASLASIAEVREAVASEVADPAAPTPSS